MRISFPKSRTIVAFLLIFFNLVIVSTASWGQIYQTIRETFEDGDFALDKTEERNEG